MAGHHRNSTEKPPKATKRAETSREVSPYNKRACLENSNGHPPSHLYLPQSEAYLPHSMVYANRYLHYSVPDGMALHSLPLPGKSPAYPPPILLGSNSLYPSHLAAKHPLPYHSYAGDYLTYNSQEMAHPLMHTHTDSKALERADQTPKSRGQGQDKPRGLKEDFGGSHRGRSDVETGEGSHVKRNKDGQPTPVWPWRPKHEGSGARARTPTASSSSSSSSPPQPKLHPENYPHRQTTRDPLYETQAPPGDRLSGCGLYVEDTEESHGEGDEDEEGGRRGSRRTSLTKRIANSSGYVGDRIKCVTTELYADSSKLSREQRALQVS
uniref:Uncharacterized protein n=1 Tax=Oncorhynchus tshawytscha TaxID=74940 RepID=A0AAZ3PAW4_ONCTS